MKFKNRKLSFAAVAVLLSGGLAPAHAKRTAAKTGPSQAQPLIQEGVAALDARNASGAIEKFFRATRLDPKSSSAFFLLGHARFVKGFSGGSPETADKSEAIAAINAFSQALSLDPDLAALSEPYRLHHAMGLCYAALGSHEKAIGHFKKAFALAPDNGLMPLYAARVRLRQGERSKAAANMTLGLKVAEKRGQKAALLKLVSADAYLAALLKDASISKAGEFSSSGLMASTAQGRALAAFRDSLRDVPAEKPRSKPEQLYQDPEVLKQLGAADEDYRFGRLKQAVDGYNQALRMNRKSGGLNMTQLSLIYEKMGKAYHRLGQSEAAIKSLRYALEEMPLNASAQYQLALSYAGAGLNKESLRALGQALESAPSKSELRKIILLAKTDSELDGLRDAPSFSKVVGPFAERLRAAQ